MQVLANASESDAANACRPFALDRGGLVLGEGAAILILEEREHALARGARILAEFVGAGSSCDHGHLTAPLAQGQLRALKSALREARANPEDVQYINAHGTSTILNDKSETAAIKTVFGETAYSIPTSSTKSMTGHLLGASGAVEAIFSILAIREGIIPPTINYHTPDPVCDLDYVPNQPRKAELTHVMSNSFGFGGHNATIVVGRFSE